MRYLFANMYRYSPDEGGGGQGDPAGNGEGDRLERRLTEAFENLAGREGGRDAAGIVLLQENRSYRERIRELERQVEQLQGQVPAEDAVVLDDEQAQQWQAYQDLGTPDEIRQQRGDYESLQRRQVLTQAAAAHGYKAPVLERLAGDLTVEMREEKQDDKPVQVAYVVPGEDGNGQAARLDQYAKEHWSDFMPALAAGGQSNEGGQGRTFVTQSPAGDEGGKGDQVDSYLKRREEQRKEQKSPLDAG